ncbi:hypothetical protein DLJ48_05530 [Oenococcus sicerae]|uniref:HTH cro/C1-type domain-containing protein n=1 Tax=Oenococcus sicerae TaxID=2203724 RepID=A0ABX5QMN3_9LACO|nr:Rgg/GadR/MutR family transcriptional regulator [Oenococcus sicerae]QAS70024.1 hypothetical protein DLJ48_05530 [Oenococcus sicerae]
MTKLALGQTFRHIRQNKHFSSKEVCAGIVSRSFLYKFEQGESDIAVSKLLQLLSRIAVSFDELTWAANHKLNFESAFYIDLFIAIENHDQRKLATLAQGSNSNSLSARLTKNLAALYVENAENKKAKCRFIYNYLLSVDNWNRYELQLCNYLIPMIQPENTKVLFQKSLDCLLSYRNMFDDSYINFFSYISLATSSVLLRSRALADAKKILQLTQQAAKQAVNERLAMTIAFQQGLIGLYEDDSTQAVKRSADIVEAVGQFNPKNADMFAKILQIHLKNALHQ